MALGMASCGNSAKDHAIAKLEDSIRVLNAERGMGEDDATYSGASGSSASDYNSNTSSNSSSSNYSSSYGSEKKDPGQFVGTYEMKDENGNTWVIKLNTDETATMGLKGESKVAYASWDLTNFLDYNPGLKFDDERALVYFPSGLEKPYLPKIVDGYFYLDSSAAQAKNPRKRLPITKVN